MQDVEETEKVSNFGLENYVKESRERLLTAARSVDINLIEPIRETTIEAKKQRRRKEQFRGRKKCCMARLCDTLRKWGIRIIGHGCKMGPYGMKQKA